MITNRVIVLLLTACTVAIMVVAGCSRQPVARRTTSPPPVPRFVGNEACQECHPKEFQEHHGTGHDLTLRFADAKSLGPFSPPSGRIQSTKYEVDPANGSFTFRRADDPAKAAKMEYAFGSGRIGMTFVDTFPDGKGNEFRMSLAPKHRAWYLTPGQERRADDDLGAIHDVDSMTKCFGCHSVAGSRTGVIPEPKFFGVGCESCHGPGGQHVDAAKTGASDLHIEKLGRLSPRQVNERCGVCHRTIEDVNLGGTEAAMTQRFQPYGIMQSPCFQKSGEAMSCLTCHDPHKNASNVQKDYEAVCLTCHGDNKQTSHTARTSLGRACPVNARDKCVGCHMPPRKVMPFSKMPVYMADHLIWAYGKKNRAASR